MTETTDADADMHPPCTEPCTELCTDDGSSLASDDEHGQQEVEVTFESKMTPHRRKSSLDLVHTSRPLLHRPVKPTECAVHQFLEIQGRPRDAAGPSTDRDPSNARPRSFSSPSRTNLLVHVPKDGLTTVEECPGPNGELEPSVINAPGSTDGLDGALKLRNFEVGPSGQEDEQVWKSETVHSIISCSDVDGSDTPTRAPSQEMLQSRLLTKRQLSDMAWGVRELSRRLSSIRLKPRVKSLFIITKIYDRDLVPKTRDLVRWLLSSDRDRRYAVYVEDTLKDDRRFDAEGLLTGAAAEYAAKYGMGEGAARDKVSKQLRYWDAELCRTKPHSFDFVITLGGDGTVLYASWLFQGIVPPVISFALGSLGFLTKFDFSDCYSTLTTAFTQGVTVSLRLRFEGTVMRSLRRKLLTGEENVDKAEEEEDMQRGRDLVEELVGEEQDDDRTHRPDGTFHVLNEIVVDRGPNPTLSNMELFGDDEHFTSILADGICVSTPTGSTAYNLAAGGSLCHPENPIMLVTSIAPHTLSFRPIILPDTMVLRVGIPYDSRTSSWASFDGRRRVELHPGDYVTISASRFPFASVQSGNRRSEDWVSSISGKLGWNTRQKQKGWEKR